MLLLTDELLDARRRGRAEHLHRPHDVQIEGRFARPVACREGEVNDAVDAFFAQQVGQEGVANIGLDEVEPFDRLSWEAPCQAP